MSPIKQTHKHIQLLSHPQQKQRINVLPKIKDDIKNNSLKALHEKTNEVNNHIHTWYSFSPYSPAMAVYKAWNAGLAACGIVDHESIAGSKEMRLAGNAFSLGITVGCELRVNFFDTPLHNKKINNPDATGIAYTVIHGISDVSLNQLDAFLKPIRVIRAKRIEQQTKKLSSLLKNVSLPHISFEKDVLPCSQYTSGGSITERHMLFACAKKIISSYGKGKSLLEMLNNKLHIIPTLEIQKYLLDENNPHYEYDLLGVLKSSILSDIYIIPDKKECPPVKEVITLAKDLHAIPAYPYLGDVTHSVTGDKKEEKFEDSYLEELFECIHKLGYLACTYMPPRNTIKQLKKIQTLSKKYDFMEISGVDINSSRQEFLYKNPKEFNHLVSSTWKLIKHEEFLNKKGKKQ